MRISLHVSFISYEEYRTVRCVFMIMAPHVCIVDTYAPHFRPMANGISGRFSSAESRNRGCIFTGVLIQPETYYDRACNAALGARVI